MIFMPTSQWPATGQANLQGCRWAGRTKHQDGAALPEFARKVISAEALRTDVWAACSGGQLPLLQAACSLQLLGAHDGNSHFNPTQWAWLKASPVHPRLVKGDGGGAVLGGRHDLLERRHVLKYG